MEVLLRNVNPDDFSLLKQFSERLGIEVETRIKETIYQPENLSVLDDLREAVTEIKLDLTHKKPLRDAWEFINEL